MEVRLDEKIPVHVNAYSAVIQYATKCGCLITSATGDTVFAARGNDSHAEREKKQTYDKLVGYMASYNSWIEKTVVLELPMIVLNTKQHFGKHDFNAFGGVLTINTHWMNTDYQHKVLGMKRLQNCRSSCMSTLRSGGW